MHAPKFLLNVCLIVAASLPAAMAQTPEIMPAHSAPSAATSATVVPMLVRYDGVAVCSNSSAPASGANITFLIYKEEKGGEPLWIETQSVAIDANGRYEIYLGSTYSAGLPTNLFGTGEARWLEVQIAGETPGSRTLLTSVPYALKAADAATLGGLPASAFALVGTTAVSPIKTDGVTPDLATDVTTTGGTNLYVPKFNGATTIINSEIYDTGTSVGIGDVPNSSARLDVNGAMIMRGNMQVTRTGNATTSKGYPSYGFQFYSNAYNSSTKANDNPYFQLQSEPTGNDTASPSATFNLLFANNGGAVAETGFYINPNGTLHFATGQTFPGTGDITGITTTSPLTGSGTSGSVALGLNTSALETTLNTVYAQLNEDNSYTGVQNFHGSTNLFGPVSSSSIYTTMLQVTPNAVPTTQYYGLQSYSPNASVAQMGMVSGGTDAAIALNNTGSGGREYWIDSGNENAAIGAGNFAIYDQTAGATRMAINPDGLVSIAASVDDVGSSQFRVNGAAILSQVVDAIYGSGGYAYGFGSIGVDGFGGSTDGSSGSTAGAGAYFAGGNADTMDDAGYGLYAVGGVGQNGFQYAADFLNDIKVDGNIVSDVATSKIDHPADPGNKYLNHASIQSSELMNLYTGNVTTDAAGRAVVKLPEWFEAENADFRYQVTTIGQDAHAWISQKIQGGAFQVATNAANVEVSWQVTAVRQDAYAKAHPLIVEEAKAAREVGFYNHPELYGQPKEKQTEWGRNPIMMKRIEAQRAARAKMPQVTAPTPSKPFQPRVSNLHSTMQSSLIEPNSE